MIGLFLTLFVIINTRKDTSDEVVIVYNDNSFDIQNYTSNEENRTDNATEIASEDEWPDIDITLHQYTMVSDSELLSAVYYPEVEVLPAEYVTYYGTKYDTQTMQYLLDMLDACRAAGFSIYVNSGYRSYSYQESIFNGAAYSIAESKGVTDYMDPDYQEAVEEARSIVNYPGSSEHQLGLAVDIVDGYHSSLKYESMDQDMFAWLDEHCAEYGFIKRYPTKKLLLTGWDESWHYRYVGVEAATYIMDHGLCYEQFYAHYDTEFTY